MSEIYDGSMRVIYEGPSGTREVTILEGSLVWKVLQGSTVVFTTIDRAGNTYTYRKLS